MLSTLIAVHAYRGYRRNGSRPMLFLTVGFAFITVIPFFLNVVFAAVFGGFVTERTVEGVVPAAEYVLQICGLAFVLYPLYGRTLADTEG